MTAVQQAWEVDGNGRKGKEGVGEEGPREVTGNKAKHLRGLNVLRELHFRSWG